MNLRIKSYLPESVFLNAPDKMQSFFGALGAPMSDLLDESTWSTAMLDSFKSYEWEFRDRDQIIPIAAHLTV